MEINIAPTCTPAHEWEPLDTGAGMLTQVRTASVPVQTIQQHGASTLERHPDLADKHSSTQSWPIARKLTHKWPPHLKSTHQWQQIPNR